LFINIIRKILINSRFINELDQDKATRLVELEKDLNVRQEQILESARKRIDSVNEEANRLKMVQIYIFYSSLLFIFIYRMF
jgi:hypothetical protein